MAQIIYDTTTGDIASVFVDTVTVGTLPSGFANKSESGVVNELADKHIDISGPTLEELDYMRFTGPDDQGVLTVETHGVQKVNGNTDVDTALIIDNDAILVQLGDADQTPGSGSGFFSELPTNLLNGAATFKLAAGAVAGALTLYVKAGAMKVASKEINYL